MSDDAHRREANQALYARMLAAQNAKDKTAFLDCVADDVVFEAPYYRPDAPLAAGKAALASVFDTMAVKFTTLDYRVKRFIDALDPDLVIVEVAGNNAVAGTDRVYRNDYLFLVEVRDGRIGRLFEYSNPVVYARDVEGH